MPNTRTADPAGKASEPQDSKTADATSTAIPAAPSSTQAAPVAPELSAWIGDRHNTMPPDAEGDPAGTPGDTVASLLNGADHSPHALGRSSGKTAASKALPAADPRSGDDAAGERRAVERIDARAGAHDLQATATGIAATVSETTLAVLQNGQAANLQRAAKPGSADDVPALVGTAAANAAAPSTTALPETLTVQVGTPAHAPEFREALGVQVSLLARDGVQSAELHLNPAEMGPISVRIVMDGAQAHVDFGADSARTREIIETGLPELAAALRDAGFTLAGGGVSQHSQGSQGSHGRSPNPPDARSEAAAEASRLTRRGVDALDDLAPVTGVRMRLPLPDSALDIYA